MALNVENAGLVLLCDFCPVVVDLLMVVVVVFLVRIVALLLVVVVFLVMIVTLLLVVGQ